MNARRTLAGTIALVSALAATTGCYHYTFEHRAPRATHAARAGVAPPVRLVTYEARRPTYLNGFVGNGRVDATQFCERPVRTELRVTGTDVLIGAATLLIYTPHTLYVTCEVPAAVGGGPR